MSFIVKGLDMPKQGEILRIEVDYDGTVWWDDGRKYHELEDSAIQIPKGHGRLKDDIKKIIAHISPDMIIAQTDYEQVERAEAVKEYMLAILEAEE